MTRRPSSPDAPLDPVVAAELDALERALAGDADADPALAALVADVRADTPVMTEEFARSLEDRVAAGFPRAARTARPAAVLGGLLARLRSTRVAWRPVLAVAATALLALAVTTAALRDGGTGGDGAGVALTETEAPGRGSADGAAAAAPEASEDSAATAPGPPQEGPPEALSLPPSIDPGGTANPGRLGGTRRVERSADLTLSTRPDDVQAVSDRVVRTAQALGGVVASSRVSASPDGGQAVFDLRVPTARLDRALRDLSALANVTALSQATDDITGSFTSAQDRLQDARDERSALLRALGRAKTDRQVSSLRARLADSRARISRIEAQIRRLRNRTDTARVAVTVLGDATQDEEEDGATGGWTPRDALDDAVRVLEVAAGVALVALAVLVPLGLLALAGLLVARPARRRARERALDTTAPVPPTTA